MSDKKFYFRCKTNPSAAPLVLDSFWEASQMKNHPDYERIDECGELIVDERDSAENQIPLNMGSRGRKVA